jgi:UDP-N-acetyl-2-amino-2-deoxyglucuronate dehydrogenase
MKDGRVGFGIVGCGTIAPWHLRGIRECPNAEAVAVCSRRADTAKAFAGEHDITRHYTDYREMVKDEDVDAICICTPSGTHADIGIAAAEAGVHVLCEKPIEITLEATDRLIRACRENGVKLGVIFQSRTYDGVREAKDAVAGGLLGPMVFGDVYIKWYRSREYYRSGGWRGTWKLDGGGALMNQGIHGIDILLWIMGGVESVFARADHFVRDIEVEDTAAAVLKYTNGAIGVLQGATSCNPGEPTTHMFHGDRGSITLKEGKLARWAVTDSDDSLAQDRPIEDDAEGAGGTSDPKAISATGHIILVADMVDAVRDDRDPMVTGESARTSVELITAIYESARTGTEVRLPLE